MKRKIRLCTLLMLLCTLFIGQQVQAQSKTSSDAYKITNKELKEYVANFKADAGPGFDITISLDGDDKLMAQPTDKRQPNTLLVALEKDKFELSNTNGIQIMFNREEDKIISITFSQGGRSFSATRVDN